MDSSVRLSCIGKYVENNSKLPWPQKQSLFPVCPNYSPLKLKLKVLVSCCWGTWICVFGRAVAVRELVLSSDVVLNPNLLAIILIILSGSTQWIKPLLSEFHRGLFVLPTDRDSPRHRITIVFSTDFLIGQTVVLSWCGEHAVIFLASCYSHESF